MYRCCTLIISYQRLALHPLNVSGIRSFSSDLLISLHKQSKSGKKKLADLVSEMNLEKDFIQPSKRPGTSVKKKEKFKDASNLSSVKAYVIGNGAIGSPKAFYLVTDSVSYLFNCGEMTQRITTQLKIRLNKLDNIFITNSIWENIGGIPGMALTRQDSKAEYLNIHGPLGIGKIFQSMKTFICLKHMEINTFETTKDGCFKDGIMDIKYVPIYPSEESTNADEPYFDDGQVKGEKSSDEEESDSDDESTLVDYYNYSRGPIDESSSLAITGETKNVGDKKRKPSICYVCKTPDILGKLNLEACAEKNVPAGPLFGRLKRKEDVTLPNGDVVNYKDVTFPDVPGKIFLVVDCPGKAYLDSLLEDLTLKEYETATEPAKQPVLIVHFTAPSVMKDPKYVRWMKSFPEVTQHLRLNEDNVDVGTPPTHKLQTKLNLIHEGIFPKLPNPAIPVIKSSEELKNIDEAIENSLEDIAINFDYPFYETMKRELLEHGNNAKKDIFVGKSFNADQDVLIGKTSMTIDLKNFNISQDSSFALWPEEYIQEALSEEGASEAIEDLKRELSEIEPSINSTTEGDYPKFVFLGTGSSCPQSIRNTSGILVFTAEDSCMLLDCGEGTYNQLQIFFGKEKAEEVMLKLKAVYVSHLHADHHLGFLGILKGRRRAIDGYLDKMKSSPEFQNLSKAEATAKLNIKPLHLLGPNAIKVYLKLYHNIFEDVASDFVLVSNSILKVLFYLHKQEFSTISRRKKLRSLPCPDKVKSFLEDVHLKEFKTTHVRHCADAYGVTFITNNDFKVTYSGDCMPSGNLIEIGRDSDILIHEATMDNDRKPDAARKLHSTTDQAVEVGKKMNAKFTMLTHFSQRYVYLPRCTEIFSEDVGIAFDMMTFSMKQIPLLPKFMPAFRLVFADKLRELDQKFFKNEYSSRRPQLKRKATDESRDRLKIKSY